MKSAPRHPASPSSPSSALWNPMSAWNGPSYAAFGQAGEAFTKACLQWQGEVSRFVEARLEEDRRTHSALTECRNLAEVAKLQQDWAATAAAAYFETFNRLASITLALAPQAWPAGYTDEPATGSHGTRDAAA